MAWLLVMLLVGGSWWLWRLHVRHNRLPPPSSEYTSTTYVSREGRPEVASEVFHAWTSGNLDLMVSALNKESNLIDRHFLLMQIVDQTYKRRSEPEMARLCEKVAEIHLAEFPKIAPALKREMNGQLPRVTTFQNYATLLSENGNFQRSIEVCEEALRFDLHDNTKSGFEGRINRIKKKQKAHGK